MEFKSNIPIYFQVIQDIKRRILSGELSLGAKLPSSRELAVEYQINPNTAARVYNEMEYMGLSFTRRGIGTFVTEDPAVIQKIREELTTEVLSYFLEQMTALGYGTKDMIELLKQYDSNKTREDNQ